MKRKIMKNINAFCAGILLFSFVVCSGATAKADAKNSKLPNVVIVTTGGTIAEKIDPKSGAAVPAESGDELINAVPELKRLANIKVISFSDIDSSQMNPEIWAKLSRKVDEILKDPKVAGVVVTHGTDTMAEGVFFLDLTLKSTKAVVFTGAMRNASQVSPDGPGNLVNAVKLAASPEGQKWGAVITLNQYVNAARYVRKMQSTNPQTFNSGAKGYLGYMVEDRILKFNDRPEKITLKIPEKLPKVPLITSFAGDNGELIRYATDSGAKGMVVEALGAGNVNAQTFKAIKYALSKGVVVVITTQVTHGGAFPCYGDEGGGMSMQKAGAVLSANYHGAKARILLMLLLPQIKKPSELKKYFQ
jgi:L-asparaginase